LNAAVAANRLLFQQQMDPLESNNACRDRAERDMPSAAYEIVATTLEAVKSDLGRSPARRGAGLCC
jgi:hypothetical protein